MPNNYTPHIIDASRLLASGFNPETVPAIRISPAERKQSVGFSNTNSLHIYRRIPVNWPKYVQLEQKGKLPVFKLPRELRDSIYHWLLQNTEFIFTSIFDLGVSASTVKVLAQYGAYDFESYSEPTWLGLDDDFSIEVLELFYNGAAFTLAEIFDTSLMDVQTFDIPRQRDAHCEIPLYPLTLHHARCIAFKPDLTATKLLLDAPYRVAPFIQQLRKDKSALRNLELVLFQSHVPEALMNISKFPGAWYSVRVGVQSIMERYFNLNDERDRCFVDYCLWNAKELLQLKNPELARAQEWLEERDYLPNVWWCEAKRPQYERTA